MGYGYQLLPDVHRHPDLPDTWTPGATVSGLSRHGGSGGVDGRCSTVPLANATIQIPEPITGVAVNGLQYALRIMATLVSASGRERTTTSASQGLSRNP